MMSVYIHPFFLLFLFFPISLKPQQGFTLNNLHHATPCGGRLVVRGSTFRRFSPLPIVQVPETNNKITRAAELLLHSRYTAANTPQTAAGGRGGSTIGILRPETSPALPSAPSPPPLSPLSLDEGGWSTSHRSWMSVKTSLARGAYPQTMGSNGGGKRLALSHLLSWTCLRDVRRGVRRARGGGGVQGGRRRVDEENEQRELRQGSAIYLTQRELIEGARLSMENVLVGLGR